MSRRCKGACALRGCSFGNIADKVRYLAGKCRDRNREVRAISVGYDASPERPSRPFQRSFVRAVKDCRKRVDPQLGKVSISVRFSGPFVADALRCKYL